MNRRIVMVAALMVLVSGWCSSALGTPFVYLSSWSATPSGEAKRGGAYRTGLGGDFKTLNPFTTLEAVNLPNQISAGGFFMFSPTTNDYIPYMAESYALSANKLVWTFKIRKGMKWSDGKPIVADDWVTTARIHSDNAITNNVRDDFFVGNKAVVVSKVNTDTVRITFPSIVADAIEIASFAPWPAHVFAPVYASKGAVGIQAIWTLAEPAERIVSSGAWQFETYRPGERVTLKRNPFFGEWNTDSSGAALPYLDTVQYAIFKDANAIFTQFLSGGLDTFAPRNADQLSQLKRATDGGQLKAVVKPNIGGSASNTFVVFNWNRKSDPVKQALFRDANFRRAISHLSHRAVMVDLVYGGLAEPDYGPIPALYKSWASPSLNRYPFNPEAALKLLSKLGYSKRNSAGLLVNPQGRILEFDLATIAGNTQFEQLAQIFTDELKKVGLKVNFRPVDFNSLVAQLTTPGDDRKWDAILISISGGSNTFPFLDVVYPCGASVHSFNASGKCLQPWESQVDALFARGKQELDTAKRRQIGYEIQNLWSLNQPFVYLVSPGVHAAWNARVRGEYPANLINSQNGVRSLVLTWLQP
jgi:peptide/nickel transport system substrate-binding protein